MDKHNAQCLFIILSPNFFLLWGPAHHLGRRRQFVHREILRLLQGTALVIEAG
jgi:hypothetical protein